MGSLWIAAHDPEDGINDALSVTPQLFARPGLSIARQSVILDFLALSAPDDQLAGELHVERMVGAPMVKLWNKENKPKIISCVATRVLRLGLFLTTV